MSWKAVRLESIPLDERRYPIRRHLGIRAFGVNGWRGAEVGDRVIDDHDELVEGHEELYLVLSGRAAFTLDGKEVDAPVGTLVFAAPAVQRGAVAAEAGTVVLAIGAEPGQPFSPSGWEEWADLGMTELVESGRYREAAERYATALERHPDHPGVLYNLACMLSLAGRHDEALERLARSIELFPKSAQYAQEDPDFDPLRDDPRFEALTTQPTDAPA